MVRVAEYRLPGGSRLADGNTTCLRCALTAQVLGVASIGRDAVTRTFIFFKLRFFIALRLLLGLAASPS